VVRAGSLIRDSGGYVGRVVEVIDNLVIYRYCGSQLNKEEPMGAEFRHTDVTVLEDPPEAPAGHIDLEHAIPPTAKEKIRAAVRLLNVGGATGEVKNVASDLWAQALDELMGVADAARE
jgi:hypothetical protein